MKAIILWCRERIELKELLREIQSVWDEYETDRIKATGDPNQQNLVHSQIDVESSHLYYQVEMIRTARRLRTASAYGIPRPSRDISSEYWETHPVLHRSYLTLNGHLYLRREIALERDLFWKPIITWAALTISIMGLLLSLYNFFTS